MSQFHLVCRKKSNGTKCLETISSGTKDDLLAAALQHASSVHSMEETRGLRDEYKMRMKKGAPPA